MSGQCVWSVSVSILVPRNSNFSVPAVGGRALLEILLPSFFQTLLCEMVGLFGP